MLISSSCAACTLATLLAMHRGERPLRVADVPRRGQRHEDQQPR